MCSENTQRSNLYGSPHNDENNTLSNVNDDQSANATFLLTQDDVVKASIETNQDSVSCLHSSSEILFNNENYLFATVMQNANYSSFEIPKFSVVPYFRHFYYLTPIC